MASEQDPALLSLIYQHLRVSGFSTAAQLLEEHVAQVQTPNERFNLRDVYTGWLKVCSLVQDAKQVTGESTASKIKSFSPGPATGDEEERDGTELSNVTGDVVSSLESKADDVESSCVGKKCSCICEQQLDTAAETDSCDGGQEEQESAPAEVSAEVTNGAESGSSDSSDSEDVIEITQEDCILLSPRQTTSNQADARPQTPEPPETCGSDSERNEENWKDDGEPKQEPEGAMDASNVREEASEPEHTPPSTVQADDEGSSAKETVADLPSLAEPASSHLTAQQTNEQLAESEAPPPADPENPEEERDEPEENPKGCGLTSPLNPKDQVDASTTTDPADRPLTDTEKATVVQAEKQEDPDDCIILNEEVENSKAAEGESSKLCPESCKNSESPTKQMSEKDTHTPTTDPVSDSPLTSECARKKKKDRKMQRKVADEEDKPQAASSEKKNAAKKRKRKMEGKDEEMLTESPKEVKGVEEESEAAEVVMESPVDTTKETKKMKKKRKGGGRQEKKKQQSDESPAGGNKDTDKSLDTTDGDSSQLSSAKREQHYKKRRFSLKKRLRLYRKNESKSSSFLEGDTTSTDHVETPRSKPTKRPQPDPPQEDVTPKKKKKMNTNTEENSSKENQPPQKKKKKQKSSAEEESGVVSDMSTDFPAEKKTKAGKGKKLTRTSTPVTASHDTPATKNKNRRKKKLEGTEAAADATPPCSCSRDTTPPHTHLGSSPTKKINFD